MASTTNPSDSFSYPRGSFVGILTDDDADHACRYTEHLRAGHYVLGTSVRDDQAAKQRAADALRAAYAESARYYAQTSSRSYPPTSERGWAKRRLARKAFES